MQIVSFLWMVMEPYFHWLPLLGLLYVLVPYYNLIDYDGDHDFDGDEDFDDEDVNDAFDYNSWDWDDDRRR